MTTRRAGWTVLLIALLTAACGGAPVPVQTEVLSPTTPQNLTATSPPTEGPTVTPDGVVRPTLLPSITPRGNLPTPVPPTEITLPAVAGPTPNPSTPLEPNGPWLIGWTAEGIVAVNADGSGRQLLFEEPTPDSALEMRLWGDYALSSTGWLATRVAAPSQPPVIRIRHLTSSTPVREIEVLSEDLAGELDRIYANLGFEDGDYVFGSLHGWGFLSTLRWSADGQRLAFTAARDGPSSDVYLYDTASDELRRLTRGPNQALLMSWSPDGRWVLHREVSSIHIGDGLFYDTEAIWAARADGGGSVQTPGTGDELSLVGWSTSDQFLATHTSFGPLPHSGLELIDVQDGPIATLFNARLDSRAFDPESSTVAVMTGGSSDPPIEAGLYLLSARFEAPRVVAYFRPENEPYMRFTSGVAWSPELARFLVVSDQLLVAFTSDGALDHSLAGVCELPKVSADGAWLAYEGCDGGLEIHSWQDAIRYRLNEPRVVDFYWAARSPELYLSVGEGPLSTVVVELPDGGVRVINPEASLGGWYWLPKTP